MWFKKKIKDIRPKDIRLNDIEARLKKLECDHKHDHVFSLHNGGPFWKRVCWNCRGVLAWYDNEKDYLTERNVYMVELIAKNEKRIFDLGK